MGEIDDIIKKVSPYYSDEDNEPSEHTLTYESYAESLEPIYYFVLDLMGDFGLKPEKLIDNFSPSPGSSEFGELGTRSSVMQQQASGMLEKINLVLKGVLNLLYDLKDFEIRLQMYDDLYSGEETIKRSARLSLKQVWLDKVDFEKGGSSLKMMVQQGSPIILDAFLAINNADDAKKLDLNDRLKRILYPRVQEFNHWLEKSEKELRNRFEIEKNYLRGQVESLKLYSRWAKPYLLAAQQLEQKISKNAALVKAFNRTILQLTLLGKRKLKVKDKAIAGEFPSDFTKDSFLKKMKREYNGCVLVDFVFRAVPQGTKAGGSTYIGRVDITFKGYSLNEQELEKLEKELENSDMGDALKMVEGITDKSLKQIQDDINYFLKDEPTEKQKKQAEKQKDESNPFLALIGLYNKPKETPKPTKSTEEKEIIVAKETYIESNFLRPYTKKDAEDTAFQLFDIYKKAHGMQSFT